MPKREKKGRIEYKRICIYVPQKDYWIFEAVEEIVQRAEDQGIPVKPSNIYRELIMEGLQSMLDLVEEEEDD